MPVYAATCCEVIALCCIAGSVPPLRKSFFGAGFVQRLEHEEFDVQRGEFRRAQHEAVTLDGVKAAQVLGGQAIRRIGANIVFKTATSRVGNHDAIEFSFVGQLVVDEQAGMVADPGRGGCFARTVNAPRAAPYNDANP